MLHIDKGLYLPLSAIEMHAVRSQGAGGQNVNKVSSAIHLRFNIPESPLPDSIKERLLAQRDNRITAEGVMVIKAQQYRTQEQNKADALLRLQKWLVQAMAVAAPRVPTRPSQAAKKRRVTSKVQRGQQKQLRQKVCKDTL
jgi:ribosome-associated protein